jgi:hypothetical protein
MHRKSDWTGKPFAALLAAIALCCGCGHGRHGTGGERVADTPPYSLRIELDGLIAYVPFKKDSHGAWALLVNADYDPKHAKETDLPPGAMSTCRAPDDDYDESFPHHVAALDFQGAKATLNGNSLDSTVHTLYIKGKDVTFDTGPKFSGNMDLSKMINRQQLKDHCGGALKDYDDHMYVAPRYTDISYPVSDPYLGARVKLDFGDSITAYALNCASTTKAYGFGKALGANCSYGTAVPLAETVEVAQDNIAQPITIGLAPGDQLVLTPSVPGGTVTLHIMNVMPKVIADPYFDYCTDTDIHLDAHRWYYRLLAHPPCDCAQHIIPTLVDGDFGGSKCPQLTLEQMP